MKIASCGRANQLQKMPYAVVARSYIPPASLCCCQKTVKDGYRDPPRRDGYTHVCFWFLRLLLGVVIHSGYWSEKTKPLQNHSLVSSLIGTNEELLFVCRKKFML